MFRSFYAVTKDRKGGIHQFRLTPGEGVPMKHEIVDLKVAGQHEFGSFVSNEDITKMYEMAVANEEVTPKKARRKRAPKE